MIEQPLTSNHISLILREPESKQLEFKSEPPAFAKLIETIVGMSNSSGGLIIIGVEDTLDNSTQSRRVVGFESSAFDKFNLGLQNSTSDCVVPRMPQFEV